MLRSPRVGERTVAHVVPDEQSGDGRWPDVAGAQSAPLPFNGLATGCSAQERAGSLWRYV